MIKCEECYCITRRGEPTCLLAKYKIWDRKRRKDIVSVKKVCFDCYEKEK